MSHKKVLVIDDNRTMREFASMTLRNADYVVITAHNGSYGIDIARQELPDLIIMDYEMPGLSGQQAAAIIADDVELRHIPILFFTNNTNRPEIASLIALTNLIGFITKPTSAEQLVRRVETAVSQVRRNESNPAWAGIEQRVKQAIKWMKP